MDAINGAKVVGVMEADFSMGSEGAVGMDLKAKLFGKADAPHVIDFIAGLGGRDVNKGRIREIVRKAEEVLNSGLPLNEPQWVGLNPAIVP